MANFEPDDIFEKAVTFLVPIWGPFYAIFYILRLFWREVFNRDGK